MTTTVSDEQLAELRARIDRVSARARASDTGAQPRIHRHLEAIRQQEASVRAAVRNEPDRIENTLGRLRLRIDVAERTVEADISANEDFAAAVGAELHSWDAYLERLQTKVATMAGPAREQAEAAIRELRRLRIGVAEGLARFGDAPDDDWPGLRVRVAAARDELERQADELTVRLH